MSITIENLAPTVVITPDHVVPAMHEGQTVKLTLGQINRLLANILDPLEIAGDSFDRGNHHGFQAISTVSGLQDALDAKAAISSVDGKVVYASKSGNYLAVANDNNAVHRYTSAATVSLKAAATLGANWHYTIIANGGAVIVDPNGSETIDGLTTLNVPAGCTAEIICDGSNFFTVVKPGGWQTIERRVFSGVNAVAFTNLAGAKDIRVRGRVTFSGASDLLWRSSTNNGLSYDAGASDYCNQVLSAVDTSVGVARQATSSYAQISTSHGTVRVDLEIIDFGVSGQAAVGIADVTAFFSGGSSIYVQRTGQFRADITARNAIRFEPVSAVTMTGELVLEVSMA